MRMPENEKYKAITIYACIVSAITVAGMFLMLNIASVAAMIGRGIQILTPVIIGFVLAYLLNPIAKMFEVKALPLVRRLRPYRRVRRGLGIACAYTLLLLGLRLIIGMVIPQVVRSYDELIGKLSQYIAQAEEMIAFVSERLPFLDPLSVETQIRELLSGSLDLLRNVAPYLTSFAAGFAEQIRDIIIGVVLSVYFMYSKERLCEQCSSVMYAFLGKRRGDKVVDFVRLTDRTFGGFIRGKLLDSLMVGVVVFILLALFRVPFYQMIAVIICVTDIIPYFGPFIGAIPSAFIILIADPIKAIWFVVIILVVQQIDGNIISPRILSESMGLSSLGVIAAITIMGGLLGVVGMFIGVPLFALILEVGKMIFAKLEHRKKQREEVNSNA